MLQPNLQRSHTGVHRTVSPRRVAQAEQRGLLHAEIDDSLRSRGGELRVRLRPFPPHASGDGSMPPPVERMASFPATPGIARDERHTAEPLVARTGSLRSVSTLVSFFPILLWAAAVLYAMSEVLLGVPAATSTFGGLLAGSTLASGVVIAIESRRKKGPPEVGAETRAQRVEDPDAVKGRRS